MIFLKRHKNEIIWGLLIVAGYFLTRLINLTILPIFTDEAIYLRWSQIMAHDAALRFLPLVDGKPPLFMWLVTISMRLLPNFDPLFAGRLVSVFSGFLGLCGIVFTSWILFKNKRISLLTAIFYLLTPFPLFYDRFALADSLLTALGIWSLGLGVFLAKTGRLDLALILGFIIGLGRLTKSPAIFFLLFLPLTLLFASSKKILKLLGLFIIIFFISEMFYSILRLFPLFNMIAQKNLEFAIPLAEFLVHPFTLTFGNLKSLLLWQFSYLTPVVSLTVLIGTLFGLKKYPREILLLVICFIFPLISMSTFNKVIYARYLLVFTPALLILAAVGLYHLQKRFPRPHLALFIFPFIIFVLPLYTNLELLTKPVMAPIPQADRDQYIDGWPAGNGIIEVRQFLADKTGVIATEGTFGLMPYALEIYQQKYFPKLEIKSYWPLPEKQVAGTDYLLMYQNQNPPAGWKLKELLRFRQGLGNDYLRLYEVL